MREFLGRHVGLDVVRGLAVLLVIFRHSELEGHFLQKFGWLGVDLFFVLSGFLIADLLFKEYRRQEKINVPKFLLRRAFKIFPPFYFFIFTTLAITVFSQGLPYMDLRKLFAELLYLQSYLPGMWDHTWSLAVEEHFYLSFSIALFLLIKFQVVEHKSALITGFFTLLVVSFCLRWHVSSLHRTDEFYGFVATHLRSDGIVLGVCTAYLLNFFDISDWISRKKRLLFALAVLLIAPGFYFAGGSFFMNTIGLTLANMGFTIIVVLSKGVDNLVNENRIPFLSWSIRIISFIGLSSYSIYLWHLAVKKVIIWVFQYEMGSIPMTSLYLATCIGIGVIMFYSIERPAMKLRDRFLKR